MEGAPHTFILDTGAEVSIVPRDFLATTNAVNQTVHSHTMKAFGRGDVLIEGPYYLNTEICGVRFVHPTMFLQKIHYMWQDTILLLKLN